MSHHAIRGEDVLGRPPDTSLFNVIEASDRPRRNSLLSEGQQCLGTRKGYHQTRTVSQVVDNLLYDLTIEDIEEKLALPPSLV
jgi:hypothetical protein